MVTRFLVTAMVLFAALGVSAEAAQKRDQQNAAPSPILFAAENAPSIKFEATGTNVPSGTVIGSRTYGLICSTPFDQIVMRGGIDKRIFVAPFRTEFEAARYTVVGDDTPLFKEQSSTAKYLVGAVVQDVKLSSCFRLPQLNAEASAEASITIEWQFFDPFERKVAFRASSTGQAKSRASTDGENQALAMAFTQAARALLANQAFYDFMSKASQAPAEEVKLNAPAFKLKPVPASTARFQEHATDTRAHVATVFSNSGVGSGFFINDGYLITNNHVVDQSKFVKVRLITGREVVGEVVATNAHRDVALVKTEAIGLKGLPVRATEAGIGAQVFVIGSPLGQENEGTVTSGIISTYRVEQDQRVIQSDVAVTHGNSGGPMVDDNGNVIGITVYGRADPDGKNLNFFIPITDALDKLGVALAAN